MDAETAREIRVEIGALEARGMADASGVEGQVREIIAAVREDIPNQQSVVYLYSGGPSPADFTVDASTPALRVPGLVLSTSGNSRAIFAHGDFNGDGKPDLATANSRYFSSTVSVLFNRGGGLYFRGCG